MRLVDYVREARIAQILGVTLKHQIRSSPLPGCACGIDLADSPWSELPYSEAHAHHVADEVSKSMGWTNVADD